MKRAYHSALSSPLPGLEPVQRVDLPNGVAFVNDLTTGQWPIEYASCDVIYSEMPWRSGYEVFNRRAGLDGSRQWGGLLRAVNRLIITTDQPIVLLWGKHVERRITPFDWSLSATLNGAEAILYGWRCPSWERDSALDGTEIVKLLCKTYDCIGDFCCGYGATGYEAFKAGKRAVLSDVNASCIGYIGQGGQTWTR